jgi:hypothetical protein
VVAIAPHDERELLPIRRPARQRPDVEEQEEHGERDEHRLGGERQRVERDDRRVTPARGPLRPDDVGEDRRKAERRREHVLPLGDPRDRLDAQRVDREERRRGCGQGPLPRRTREHEEHERRVERVKEDARPVVRARVEAEERHVGHVGEPRHGVPVPRMDRRQRPDHAVRRQPFRDPRVGRDVDGVVVVEEGVFRRRPEHRGDDEREPGGDDHVVLAALRHDRLILPRRGRLNGFRRGFHA